MADYRQKAAEDLSQSEGIDPSEAQALVDAILQNADFSQLPPEHQGPVDDSLSGEDLQYEQSPDEEVLVDEMLDSEMAADQATLSNNPEAFRHAKRRYTEAARKLMAIRQKKAMDLPPSNDPQEQEDEELLNMALERNPQADKGVLAEAVGKASQHKNDPTTNVNDNDQALELVDYYINQSGERQAYASLRNLNRPLVCPKCSRKVARQKDNPMRFKCAEGHTSELNLEKVAYDPNLGPWEELNSYEAEESLGQPIPSTGLDRGTGDETPTPGTLTQDEKNRMNGVLYESMTEATTPLYVLGVADGFFETGLFEQLCVSQDEISEYQSGMKKGRSAKGGETNIAEF